MGKLIIFDVLIAIFVFIIGFLVLSNSLSDVTAELSSDISNFVIRILSK